MMRKIIDIVLFSFCSLAVAGCPDNKSSEDVGPASGGTGDPAAGGETSPDANPPGEPVRPDAMPMLCTLDGGKWCSPCPSGDAGPLCCSDVCVPWAEGQPCGGAVGWCSNYTTSTTTPAGNKVSTCHDDP